ncbi:MAG: respiratory nitrate reductase subunit gamma [Bacillota bacterium]
MALLVFIYVSLFAFIFLSLSKAAKFAKMPMHSRWELYPVPKEKGERGEYGGSYFEDLEWWNKPREVSHIGELKEMLKEMLFIKNLFVNQRPFWWLSYSLHLGIYLLGLWTVILAVGAVTELSGIAIAPGGHWWASLVYNVTVVSGAAGAVLTGFGSLALFLRRLTSGTLQKYTTPQEYFNLLFIFAVVISGIMVWAGDPAFEYGRVIMKSMFTFTPFETYGALTVHIILLGLLLIYIPQTKMSHYVGKYFTYHKILWDNEPNLRGSKMEEVVRQALSYKPKTSWSAPHIKPSAPQPTDTNKN